jgi:hypothetical protein
MNAAAPSQRSKARAVPAQASVIGTASTGTPSSTTTRAIPRADLFIAAGPRSTPGTRKVSKASAVVVCAAGRRHGIGITEPARLAQLPQQLSAHQVDQARHGDHHRSGDRRQPCPSQAIRAYLSHSGLPRTRTPLSFSQAPVPLARQMSTSPFNGPLGPAVLIRRPSGESKT